MFGLVFEKAVEVRKGKSDSACTSVLAAGTITVEFLVQRSASQLLTLGNLALRLA